jgi:hypothetical protein
VENQSQSVYWVADSAVPSRARLGKYYAWDHHPGRLHRRAFSISNSQPNLQLFSIRTRELIDDNRALKEQGLPEGDVLILLPDSNKEWFELLGATASQFPLSLPTDLPFTDWRPLEELVEKAEEKERDRQMSEPRGGVSIVVHGNLNNIGMIAQSINSSANQVSSAPMDDNLKSLLVDLHKQVGALVPHLSENDAEAAAEDLSSISEQVALPPQERRVGRIRQALSDLASIASQVAVVGAPVIELISQVKAAFGL